MRESQPLEITVLQIKKSLLALRRGKMWLKAAMLRYGDNYETFRELRASFAAAAPSTAFMFISTISLF